jgi:hypothetical protein
LSSTQAYLNEPLPSSAASFSNCERGVSEVLAASEEPLLLAPPSPTTAHATAAHLLDGTLVNATALVDHVAGGGRLAGVDVADNDDVNLCESGVSERRRRRQDARATHVELLLAHGERLLGGGGVGVGGVVVVRWDGGAVRVVGGKEEARRARSAFRCAARATVRRGDEVGTGGGRQARGGRSFCSALARDGRARKKEKTAEHRTAPATAQHRSSVAARQPPRSRKSVSVPLGCLPACMLRCWPFFLARSSSFSACVADVLSPLLSTRTHAASTLALHLGWLHPHRRATTLPLCPQVHSAEHSPSAVASQRDHVLLAPFEACRSAKALRLQSVAPCRRPQTSEAAEGELCGSQRSARCAAASAPSQSLRCAIVQRCGCGASGSART